MKFSSHARFATLLLSAAVVTAAVAQPAPDKKALVPTTLDSIQYDGQGPWLFLDRPIKGQGLDTLVSRGRVRQSELVTMDHPPAALPPMHDGVTGNVRTIFRDLYTGAEVWRLTDYINGSVGQGGWNPNGRFIRHGDFLMEQESCAWGLPAQMIGQFGPGNPYMTYFRGPYKGQVAAWAYDMMKREAYLIGPPASKGQMWGGITSISPDGQWVCWLEGTQDLARRVGVAKTDGSMYRSIRWDGGIVHEQSPATMTPPPASKEGDSDLRGGFHYVSFTRSPDNVVMGSINGPLGDSLAPNRLYFLDVNGKLVNKTPPMSHGASSPDGKSQIFERGDGVSGRDMATEQEYRVFSSKGRTEGHTSWAGLQNWAEASWMGPVGWEILRLSTRGDRSVIRLCGVCSQDPQALTYNSMPFGVLSPDGTKVKFLSSLTNSINAYLVVAANPQAPQKLTGQWTTEGGGGFKLTWTPAKVSRETKGYRIYKTDRSGQNYRQVGWVETPEGKFPCTDPMSFVVPGVKQGEKAFFAVRAQEWSGLLSRYSNDVASEAGASVAAYVEPESCEFSGFMQGFDPVNAGNMYYVFVPTAITKCEVSFKNPNKDAVVWARVGSADGANVGFTVNGTAIPAKTYADWTWVNLGKLSGEIKLSSESKGFKLNRFFVTSDGSTPTGRGLDYPTEASFTPPVPANVQAKPQSPFAAEVTWAAIPGVRYYNVYAADKPDFVPAQANLLYSPPVDERGTERVVDWGLKPGTQYYYKVVAVNYDGVVSQPSSAIAVATPAITVQTVNVDYATGTGGTIKDDPKASNGKMVVLKPNETLTVKFNVPVDGDYVIWHQWRMDKSDRTTVHIELNDKKENHIEWYHMGLLYGNLISKEFLWSRYSVWIKKGTEGIYSLKAGENTIKITLIPGGRVNELDLNKLIITNDQSFIPDGKLCIY
ncbi:MAG: fibronectin type III domain-containing protein [Phycisphaerales bacterium]|nr:fibronectin type III domain-containing protein [Phycisphaerales bacterium]